ncbi:MAG: hypothetical protein ACKVWR_06355 [Acidimicrobiales bacterium]
MALADEQAGHQQAAELVQPEAAAGQAGRVGQLLPQQGQRPLQAGAAAGVEGELEADGRAEGAAEQQL